MVPHVDDAVLQFGGLFIQLQGHKILGILSVGYWCNPRSRHLRTAEGLKKSQISQKEQIQDQINL